MGKSNRKFKRKLSANNVNNSSANKMISKLTTEAQEYYDNNQLEQANYLYQQVLQLQPENIMALNGLGLIAMQAGMMSIAVEFLAKACELEPKNMVVNKNLALVYTRMSNYEEAIMQYIIMLDIDESNSEVHGELARLNLQIGHLDLALHHYRYAFDLNPEDPRNIHGIIQLAAESISDSDLATMENILSKSDLPLEQRCSFYFALGNIYDKQARYDEAFANYSVANMCKGEKFDNVKHAENVTNIINTFSSEAFEGIEISNLNKSEKPVFILGMPRSGTTLVEQILASHTDVFAAGELSLINEIAGRLNLTSSSDKNTLKSIAHIDAESVSNLAQYYINNISNLADKGDSKNPLRISDKLPGNFLHLGLIALLFPNAKIIHCRRNPLDVCLSCYFQNFSGNHSYAYDLRTAALYYQQYERLMLHWEKVLPIEIHTVDYEDLVTDTENESKRLIKHINLDWQKECLEFHKAKRLVNTASLAQVRNKIYKSSLNRSQHYDKYLHMLKKTLNLIEEKKDEEDVVLINAHDFRKEFKALKSMH